jgi:riboflavin kinase/FMN adenylyltransferase
MSELAREELRRVPRDIACALTIGVFDGVHLGHQHLFRHLRDRAAAQHLASAAVTLYPHPAKVLRPQEPVQYLTSLEERLELMRAQGIDHVLPLTFTSELAELSPDAFLAMLASEIDLRLLVMGPDNAFGRNREATPERVAAIGERLGFAVEVLPRPLATTGRPVSATAIREALAAGDLDLVARQLGRLYSIRGPVVMGDQRGRTIGFPTANIAITADRALPAFGVYATWAYLGETRYASATNIGNRPTVGGVTTTVETHILDFDADIYGESLKIELVERLRPEERFDGLDALKAQIARDVDRARAVLI